MDKKVIAIVAVFFVIILLFMGFMMMTLMGINKELADSKEDSASEEIVAENDSTKDNKEDKDSKSKKVEAKKVGINDIETYSFGEPITTVLVQEVGDTNSHIAKIAFAVGMDKNNKETKNLTATFAAKDILFRDMIIGIVSGKSISFYNTPTAKEDLKKEIKEKFSKELSTTAIVEVYMPEYYVQ